MSASRDQNGEYSFLDSTPGAPNDEIAVGHYETVEVIKCNTAEDGNSVQILACTKGEETEIFSIRSSHSLTDTNQDDPPQRGQRRRTIFINATVKSLKERKMGMDACRRELAQVRAARGPGALAQSKRLQVVHDTGHAHVRHITCRA